MPKSRKKEQIREVAKFACHQSSSVQGRSRYGELDRHMVERVGYGRAYYKGHLIRVIGGITFEDGHYAG